MGAAPGTVVAGVPDCTRRPHALAPPSPTQDFTDSELEQLLHLAATAAGLRWAKRAVCKAALQLLIRERIKPNFGNAGAVNALMGRVKTAVAGRGDARSRSSAHASASAAGTTATASLRRSPTLCRAGALSIGLGPRAGARVHAYACLLPAANQEGGRHRRRPSRRRR